MLSETVLFGYILVVWYCTIALPVQPVVCHVQKPANILWTQEDNSWRIIDFGCTVPIGAVEKPVFTLRYAAPESVLSMQQKATVTAHPSQDVWAIGVIAFEMMSGEPLFPLGSTSEQVQQILLGKLPFPHEDNPNVWRKVGKLKELVHRMRSRDASQRPSAAEVTAKVDAMADMTGATMMAFNKTSTPQPLVMHDTTVTNSTS